MGGDAAGRATQARTQFLVGDPAMFARVATRFRLMIYSPDDVDALGPGARRPVRRASRTSSRRLMGRTHLVEWSSSGGGGSFIVTCDTLATPCTVTQLASWMT
jgi:hypothetical protein